MHFRCRACHQEDPPAVLGLGQVPASDHFPPAQEHGVDPTWPLVVHMCPACGCVQLGPERGAQPEPASAVDSETALEHARRSVRAVVAAEGLRPGQTVLELDSSHGASWLPAFLEEGLVAARCDEPADLVVDVHHLMHQEDVDAVIAAHAARLAGGGRLVCEFFHVLPLVEHALIDTFRHGHFVYLSVLAAEPLFARHGLTLTRAVLVDAYGGSVRLTAARTVELPTIDPSVKRVIAREREAALDQPETLRAMGRRGQRVAAQFREHLQLRAAEGRRIAGYGAPSKAAVLLALSGVDVALLPYTVDLSPAKHGCRVPGAGVPIRPVESLLRDRPDDVVVLTWDIADEVVRQLRAAVADDWCPRLYVPLPAPRELSLRE